MKLGRLGFLLAIAGAVSGPGAPAQAASAGLVVVIANEYDGHLPGATRDANAVADALEKSGFSAVRLLGAASDTIAAGIEQVRTAAEGAGPFRIVYATGFGMCLNDDLVLFAEDTTPEQFQSGQVGDVVIPLSVVREAAAEGGGQTLVVFDTDPKQCTESSLKAIKLPEKTALLVTTGIGGDVIEVGDEADKGAFATAFLRAFAIDRAPKEILAEVVEQIETLTEEQQVPIVVGGF